MADAIDPQPSHRTPPEFIGGIPYVSIGDLMEDRTINFEAARKVSPSVLEEHKQRYSLQLGDFIFGKIGTLGKPFRLTSPFNYALSANVILLQPKSSFLTNEWLYYFLKSPFIENLLKRDSRATSQAAFGIKRIRSLPVPIPPTEEQQKIVAQIENCLAITSKFEVISNNNFNQIDYLNQSILAKAFRGELVEQDPNDEPASVLLDRIRAELQAQEGKKSGGARGKRKKASNDQLDLPGME